MKAFFYGMIDKPQLKKRLILCFIAVCIMGSCVSWLNLLSWGTDPCSVMNLAVAKKVGMTFGNWQALLNCFLFILVFLKGRHFIGFGTVFNMFLVGYACDFMTWLRETLWPELAFSSFPVQIAVCVVVLGVFVVAVGIYMSVDLGTAPYDAMALIASELQSKFSFRTVRIGWDCLITVIGFGFGGVVGVVTVLMCFSIGPMAALVGKKLEPFIS